MGKNVMEVTISVIVPVYNVEKYLKRCLESILKQTFRNFEVILVDDGSTDGSSNLCERYAKQYKNINVIHQQNAGQAVARNKGLDWCFAESDCQYIAFVDSDDWIEKQYFEVLINGFSTTEDIDVSICDFIHTSEFVSKSVVYQDFKQFKMSSADFMRYNVINSIVPWGKLYRKKCFENIRYPEGMKHEDEFVTYKILLNRDNVCVSERPLYYYFKNENSVSYSEWTHNELATIKAIEEKLSYIKNKNLSMLYRQQLEHYVFFVCDCCKQIEKNEEYKKHYLSSTQKKLKLMLKELEKVTGSKLSKDKEWIYDIAYPFERKIYWIIKSIIAK